MNSIFIDPVYTGADTKGDGGIRRVVEAQNRWLTDMGWKVVLDPLDADVLAYHAMLWRNPPRREQLVVSHNHGLYWSEYEWPELYYTINREVVDSLRRADVVTAPSKWVAYALARGMWLDAKVIHHGINTDEFATPLTSGLGYVLWNKARWDNVSDPGPMNQLAKLAGDVQFVSTFGDPAPNVKLVRNVSYADSLALVREAGVYLCTTQETFGIGTLEAMAAGVPILGWNFGGQAEFVQHGVTGWLSRPGDYQDLLAGLRHCLANRASMGLAAREYVFREHDWRSVMRQYHDLYVSHLGVPGRLSPRVSIITTCHKLERFLGQAIQSALAQRMQDWEMIVVDDCSPGDSLGLTAEDIVGQFADSRIRVVHTPSNLYQAGALNYGCSLAAGRYLFCMDADNEVGDPECLGLLCDVLDQHRELDIVYGMMEYADFDNDTGRQLNDWLRSDWPPRSFSYAEQMRGANQVPSQCLWRRRIWQQTCGYRQRWRAVEDADMWSRAAMLGFKAARVGDFVTLRYKVRSGSISRDNSGRTQNWWMWFPSVGLSPKSKAAPWAANIEGAGVSDGELMGKISGHPTARVTFVIPVGPGHGQYVIDAIDSIVNQTVGVWRIIVVNDSGESLPPLPPFVSVLHLAQTDDASAPASSLGHGHGPSFARNFGIAACDTPLFVLLDADDYIAPTFLEHTLRAYDQVGGGFIYTDWIHKEASEVKPCADWDLDRLLEGQFPPITCLYPRQAWIDCGGFDESLTRDHYQYEDWDWFLRLVEAGYCGTRLAEPLLYYRMSLGSVRHHVEKHGEGAFAPIRLAHVDKIRALKENPTMGCGCGGGGFLPPWVPDPVMQLNGTDGDLVLLKFDSEGHRQTTTYRGPATGTPYRFGPDDGHNKHWVHKDDAKTFLLLDEFKRASADEEANFTENRPGSPGDVLPGMQVLIPA